MVLGGKWWATKGGGRRRVSKAEAWLTQGGYIESRHHALERDGAYLRIVGRVLL
jgi:hypothetical protein